MATWSLATVSTGTKIYQMHFTWQKFSFWNNSEKLNPLAFKNEVDVQSALYVPTITAMYYVLNTQVEPVEDGGMRKAVRSK